MVYKPSRRRTWHSPGGEYYNQIDYIIVKRRFQSSVYITTINSISRANIGSDQELAKMTFRLRLQRMNKQGNIGIKFRSEKLKDPNIEENVRATTGGRFAPLLVLDNQDTEVDTLVNSFNTAVTERATDIFGKHRPTKKP